MRFSTCKEDDDDGDMSEGGSERDDEDDDDEVDDDEVDSIECKISFSKVRFVHHYKQEQDDRYLLKHQMGVMLVVALATEEAFSVKSVSYSRDTSIATEHPGGEAWTRRALYSGKVCEFNFGLEP